MILVSLARGVAACKERIQRNCRVSWQLQEKAQRPHQQEPPEPLLRRWRERSHPRELLAQVPPERPQQERLRQERPPLAHSPKLRRRLQVVLPRRARRPAPGPSNPPRY
jgi:hypothetical protein